MRKPVIQNPSVRAPSASSYPPRGSTPTTFPAMLVVPPRADLRADPITTPRLLLSPVDSADAAELWLAVDGSRAHLEPWLPWVPFNSDPVANQRFTDACASDWDTGRAVRFTVRERSSRTLVGVVGLEACVHLHRSCELGYWLRRDAIGRGYMTEAAQAAVDFAFHQMGAHRVRVAASTENHRSLQVIGRLGFRFEGILRQAEFCNRRWLDHAVFGLLSTDLPDGK
jgi:ribosomal-protein-serine acetyltransferase